MGLEHPKCRNGPALGKLSGRGVHARYRKGDEQTTAFALNNPDNFFLFISIHPPSVSHPIEQIQASACNQTIPTKRPSCKSTVSRELSGTYLRPSVSPPPSLAGRSIHPPDTSPIAPLSSTICPKSLHFATTNPSPSPSWRSRRRTLAVSRL